MQPVMGENTDWIKFSLYKWADKFSHLRLFKNSQLLVTEAKSPNS